MHKLAHIEGVAAPLPMINIDTDKIIPAMYLKTTVRTGLGKGLFGELRYRTDGSENPDFILNKLAYRNAQILIAGENFGCGSSREHASWALMDFGIRCVVAPSFADIFDSNCFKAGMLTIALPQGAIDDFMAEADNGANAHFAVDIAAQTITSPDGRVTAFEIDPFRKHCLLNGLNDIGLTLQQRDTIDDFERRHLGSQPWLTTS